MVNVMSDELHWMSAGQLATAIAAGEVTSSDALEHLVARIKRLDGPINAVVHWDLDRARREAAAADAPTSRPVRRSAASGRGGKQARMEHQGTAAPTSRTAAATAAATAAGAVAAIVAVTVAGAVAGAW